MIIKIIEERELSVETDQEIRNALCKCFPDDCNVFRTSRAWHGSSPEYSVIVVHDEKIIAHVGVVNREISVGGAAAVTAVAALTVAGIQNVFVFPEHRGKGLVDKIMQEAMNVAAEKKFDCGLLFCVPALEKIYSRCSWKTLTERKLIRINEEGNEVSIPGKNIAMFYPLKISEFPYGNIHLLGNDW